MSFFHRISLRARFINVNYEEKKCYNIDTWCLSVARAKAWNQGSSFATEVMV
jgi:hypothetical protein